MGGDRDRRKRRGTVAQVVGLLAVGAALGLRVDRAAPPEEAPEREGPEVADPVLRDVEVRKRLGERREEPLGGDAEPVAEAVVPQQKNAAPRVLRDRRHERDARVVLDLIRRQVQALERDAVVEDRLGDAVRARGPQRLCKKKNHDTFNMVDGERI